MSSMFEPSKKEIWRQLCVGIGARYVEGGFWKGDKVEGTHGPWTITLDTHTVSTGKQTFVYTRMRVPYVNPGGFRFAITRRNAFSGLAKWLGMQDLEVGDPLFDEAFIVKSTDESRVRALFSNPRLRDLVALQPDIRFSVKDDEGWFGPTFPEEVDELRFMVLGVIKDLDRLTMLYELFTETLDHLCRIGAAYSTTPDVKL